MQLLKVMLSANWVHLCAEVLIGTSGKAGERAKCFHISVGNAIFKNYKSGVR